jgi:hypothetical protein
VTRIVHRPGLFVLNGIFEAGAQRAWIQRCLFDYAEPPNITNLSVSGVYTQTQVYKNMHEKLRWATLGNDYNWDIKGFFSDFYSNINLKHKNLIFFSVYFRLISSAKSSFLFIWFFFIFEHFVLLFYCYIQPLTTWPSG